MNQLERMARPLPALHTLLTRLHVDERVVSITPGDIILATARRPDD